MIKKLIIVFVAAFILNVLWEKAHSFLYLAYKDGAITDFILLRAALFDAFVILAFSIPFLRYKHYERKQWLLFLILITFAIGLEKWGLSTGRWIYKESMPLIPYIWTGLTPTLQLGLTGFISFRIAKTVA